jgi:hypothetical protein
MENKPLTTAALKGTHTPDTELMLIILDSVYKSTAHHCTKNDDVTRSCFCQILEIVVGMKTVGNGIFSLMSFLVVFL